MEQLVAAMDIVFDSLEEEGAMDCCLQKLHILKLHFFLCS